MTDAAPTPLSLALSRLRMLLGLQPLTPKGGKNLFKAISAYPLRVQREKGQT